MSGFLKLTYELIAKIIYNIVQCFAALFQLLFTGWAEYAMTFPLSVTMGHNEIICALA